MASNVSTSSDLNGYFNLIYEEAMFELREINLMAQLVTSREGVGMARRKQGINPQITAQEVAEGVDFTNATKWEKSEKMELVPKIAKAQTIITQTQIDTDPDDTRADASMELGDSVSTKVDIDLLEQFAGFDHSIGAAGQSLTISKCAAGLAIIQVSKARAPYYYVLHPYGWHDIWVELGQPVVNAAFLGDVANEALRNYQVAQFNGATWFHSTNIEIDSADDVISGVFTREALVIDVRKSPTLAIDEDPSIAGYGYELNIEAIYAVGTRREEHGCKLIHDAQTPTGS